MYPYILVCHLESKTLVRHLRYTKIPDGFVKIINYKSKLGKFTYWPYDQNGQLKLEYWSLPRAIDIINGNNRNNK